MSVDALAQKMFDYFQPYGFDMTPVKRDPFAHHEDSRFSLTPYSFNGDGSYRVVSETFFDFSKYRNTPMQHAAWVLGAKIRMDGPKGTFQPGDWATFGMFR